MSEGMVEMTEADARELEFYRRSDAVQSERAKNKRSGAQMFAAVKRAISNNPDCFEELLDRARAARDRGATLSVNDTLVVIFQSTLPRRGATALQCIAGRRGEISIHAPPKGSDRRRGDQRPRGHISIHAPPKGSD